MEHHEPIPSPFVEPDMMKPGDNGHIGLIQDLTALLRDATRYAFHDWKDKKYPIPKAALVISLEKIIQRTKTGYYKNVL